MEVNNWIKFGVREKLEECVDAMCMQLSEKIAELALSKSVEGVIRATKEILLDYIRYLPIDEEYFYFLSVNKV